MSLIAGEARHTPGGAPVVFVGTLMIVLSARWLLVGKRGLDGGNRLGLIQFWTYSSLNHVRAVTVPRATVFPRYSRIGMWLSVFEPVDYPLFPQLGKAGVVFESSDLGAFNQVFVLDVEA